MKSIAALSFALFFSFTAHASGAHESVPARFPLLMQQYAQGSMPTAQQLAQNEWGFVAVVGNPSLTLEQGEADRVDYVNGLKNADNSVMSLIFTQQDPRLFPFMALERQCYWTMDNSEFFLTVVQDTQKNDIRFSYTADETGNDASMVLINECRLSASGSDQLLICPVTMKLQDPVPPVYQAPEYQQANGKVISVQVYKNGSWDPSLN
jgi:hypothetical protein